MHLLAIILTVVVLPLAFGCWGVIIAVPVVAMLYLEAFGGRS